MEANDRGDGREADEGEQRADPHYYPMRFRRAPTNAEFWDRVQGRRGVGLGQVVVLVLAGAAGALMILYRTGIEPKEVVDWIGKKAIASATGVRSAVSARLSGDGCGKSDAPAQLQFRWSEPEASARGPLLEYINETGGSLLIRLYKGEGGALQSSVMVAAGQRAVVPGVGARDHMVVQLPGRRWCDAERGWADGQLVEVDTGRAYMQGALLFEKHADGDLRIKETPWAARPVAAAPARAEVQSRSPASQGAQGPQVQQRPTNTWPTGGVQAQPGQRMEQVPAQPAAAAAAAPVRKLALQPSQTEIENAKRARERAYQAAVIQQGQQQEAEAAEQAAASVAVRTQDWRDVPPREIRLVTNGSRHYLGGKVGEEDVQFLLRPDSISAIGDDLARRVGASACRNGRWFVLNSYWTNCQKLVPSLSMGNVTLENVLIAVVPGSQAPVIGWDLVGRGARIFRGVDGNYVAIGR